jgi:hypothetical protein
VIRGSHRPLSALGQSNSSMTLSPLSTVLHSAKMISLKSNSMRRKAGSISGAHRSRPRLPESAEIGADCGPFEPATRRSAPWRVRRLPMATWSGEARLPRVGQQALALRLFHEPGEIVLVVGVPAREGRAISYDVLGSPAYALVVHLRRSLVVRAKHIEFTSRHGGQ